MHRILNFMDLIHETEEMFKKNRLVGRDIVNGLCVSTVAVNDIAEASYETAIMDKNAAYPVERYLDVKSALEGHKRWVEKAPTLEKVIRLSSSDWEKLGVEDGEVILMRKQ